VDASDELESRQGLLDRTGLTELALTKFSTMGDNQLEDVDGRLMNEVLLTLYALLKGGNPVVQVNHIFLTHTNKQTNTQANTHIFILFLICIDHFVILHS
jgi:hypothetical protein